MKNYFRVVLPTVIAVVLLLPLLLIADGPAVVDVSYASPMLHTGETFLTLTDTPASYAGYAGSFLVVNDAENALEYADALYEDSSNRIEVRRDFAADGNTVRDGLGIYRTHASGAGADGIGSRVSFYAETETGGTDARAGHIDGVLVDATEGTQDGQLKFYTYKDDATVLGLTVDEDGDLVMPWAASDKYAHMYYDATYQMGLRFEGANRDLVLYAQAADNNENIHLEVNGVAALSVVHGGSVGIGTTTPTSLLDVEGNLMVNGQAEVDWSTTGSVSEHHPLLILDAQPQSGTGTTGYGPELRFEIYGNYRGGIAQVYNDDVYPQTRFEFRAGAGVGNETLVGVIVGPTYRTMEGNPRGDGAVDFNVARSNSADVASGDYAVISGGTANTASGLYAVVGGGGMNTASGDWATIAGGEYNDAIGHYSVAAGRYNEAVGHFSEARGMSSIARRYGEEAYAAGGFAVEGDAQRSTFIARENSAHTTSAWVPLYLDGISERMVLATNDVWAFEILVACSTVGATQMGGYTINGVIENDDGSTTLRASNVTTLYESVAAWDVRVVADTTNDALAIEVRDSAASGQTIFWVATIEATIVNF